MLKLHLTLLNYMLLPNKTLGHWFLSHLASMILAVDGCIESSTIRIVLLSFTKLVLLPKDLLNEKALII